MIWTILLTVFQFLVVAGTLNCFSWMKALGKLPAAALQWQGFAEDIGLLHAQDLHPVLLGNMGKLGFFLQFLGDKDHIGLGIGLHSLEGVLFDEGPEFFLHPQ